MNAARKQQLEADLRGLVARSVAPFPPIDAERGRELVDAAFRHGLAHELARRLPDDAFAGAPELRARLARGLLAQELADRRLRGALDEAVAALAGAGIVPVALKGPVLADRVYPVPALRPATDLDLLVLPSELDAAISAVAPCGWRPDASAFEDAYARRHHHHVHVGRPGGPDIELHFRANVGFGAVLDAAPLLARAREHRLAGGGTVRVLSPEDEVLVLAVHAAVHLHERLGWLLDLALLLDSVPVDGAALAARARAAGAERALAFTSAALADLGVEVPGATPRLGRGRARIAAAIRRRALARAEVARDRSFAACVLLFETVLADRAATAALRIAHQGWWSARRNAHRVIQRLRPRAS